MVDDYLIDTTINLISYTSSNTYAILGFIGVIQGTAECVIPRTASSFSVSSRANFNGSKYWLTIGY
jgi:hypothetical protein